MLFVIFSRSEHPSGQQRFTPECFLEILVILLSAAHIFSRMTFVEDESVVNQTKLLLEKLDEANESRLARALKESLDDLARAKKCRNLVSNA